MGMRCTYAILGYVLSVTIAFAQPTGAWFVMPIPPGTPGLNAVAWDCFAAVGNTDLSNGHSGILERDHNYWEIWRTIPLSKFTPPLQSSFTGWNAIAGTATNIFVCGNNSTVYRRAGFSSPWLQCNSGIPPGKTLRDIEIYSSSLLVVGDDGVAYYSANSGNSWTPQNTGTTNDLHAISFDYTHLGWFYIVGENNTVLHFTAPNTWTTLSIGSFATPGQTLTDITTMGLLYSTSVPIICGSTGAGSPTAIYSTDDGLTWNDMHPPSPTYSYFHCLSKVTSTSNVWVGNTPADIYYVTNYGQSWLPYGTNPPAFGIGDIVRDIDTRSGSRAGLACGGTSYGWLLQFLHTPRMETPDEFDFGILYCDEVSTLPFTISNTGTTDLIIDEISTSVVGITITTPGPPPWVIPAGQSLQFTVHWDPQSSSGDGVHRKLGVLEIWSNNVFEVEDHRSIPLYGGYYRSEILVNPPVVEFPSVCIGSSRDTMVVLRSNFPTTKINKLRHVSGDDIVSLVSPLPLTTIPDSSLLVFRFEPQDTGLVTGTYELINDDPYCPDSCVIEFKGYGRESVFSLGDNPYFVDSLCAGQVYDTVYNFIHSGYGEAWIEGRQFISGSHVFHDYLTYPTPVYNPGDTIPYRLRFEPGPNDVGVVTGTYRYFFAPCNSADITFTAFVYENRLAGDDIVDFGTVCPGAAVDSTLTYTNTGSGDVRIIERRFVAGSDAFQTEVKFPTTPLQEGGKVQFTTVFQPLSNDTGIVTGVYKFITGPCLTEHTVTYSGRVAVPRVEFTPASPIAIQAVSIGQKKDTQVVATNRTRAPITVKEALISPSGGSMSIKSPTNLPLRIDNGETLTIKLHYEPLVLEDQTYTIALEITEPCAAFAYLEVSARAIDPPSIRIADTLAFGLQRCNTAIRDTITVHNDGPGALSLSGFSIEGASAGSFSVIEPKVSSVILDKGDSLLIVIEMNHPIESATDAYLVLTHNDPVKLFQSKVILLGSRQLSGVRIISMTGNTFSCCPGDSVQQLFAIVPEKQNTDSLLVTDIALSQTGAAFNIDGTTLPHRFSKGDTLFVTVRFRPGAVAAFPAQLLVTTSPCNDQTSVALDGIGLGARITFQPQALDFKNMATGESSTLPLQYYNAGVDDIIIDSINIVPANADIKLIGVPSLPYILNPNKSNQLQVTYAPTVEQAYRGELQFSIKAPCRQILTVPIKCTSFGNSIVPELSNIEFKFSPCEYRDSCQRVLIRNFTGQPHIIDNLTLVQSGSLFSVTASRNIPFQIGVEDSFLVDICVKGELTGSDSAIIHISTSTGARTNDISVYAFRDSLKLLFPQEVHFGALARCEAGRSTICTVLNTGNTSDTLIALPTSGHFGTTAQYINVDPGPAKIQLFVQSPGFGFHSDTLFFQSVRCGTLYAVPVRAKVLDSILQISPIPLVFGNTQVGVGQTLALVLMNRQLAHVRVSDVEFGNAEFQSPATFPLSVDSLQSETIDIRFIPVTSGQKASFVRIIVDEPCDDTLLVPLQGNAVEDGLYFQPPNIAFGEIAQCETKTDTFVLHNSGSTTITIDSAMVLDTATWQIQNPVSQPEILPPLGVRPFVVTAAPIDPPDGPRNTVLSVFTSSVTQPIVQATCSLDRTTFTIPQVINIELDTITIGETVSFPIRVQNTGTAALTFGGAVLPPGYATVSVLPWVIANGVSVDFTMELTPFKRGTVKDTLFLVNETPCVDTCRVIISGYVEATVVLRQGPDKPTRICDTVFVPLTLCNLTEADAVLDRLVFSGADGSRCALYFPTLPFPVPASDSVRIVVSIFQPDRTQGLLFTTSADVTVGVTTLAVSVSSMIPPLSPNLVLLTPPVFPGRTIGAPAVTLTLLFVNESAIALQVDSVWTPDEGLTIQSITPSLPLSLSLGDSLLVELTYLKDSIGHSFPLLQIAGSQPGCVVDMPYDLNARTLPPETAHVRLSIPRVEGTVDEVVRIPVNLEWQSAPVDISGFKLQLSYNRSMLHPLRIASAGTLSESTFIHHDWDYSTSRLTLYAQSPVASGDGELTAIEFLVLVGSDSTTSITFTDSTSIGAEKPVMVERTDGQFTLIGYCFGGGSRLTSNSPGDELFPPVPNPALGSTTIRYRLSTADYVKLVLVNHLGIPIHELATGFRDEGLHTIEVNSSVWPSGTYSIVLQRGPTTRIQRLSVIH